MEMLQGRDNKAFRTVSKITEGLPSPLRRYRPYGAAHNLPCTSK